MKKIISLVVVVVFVVLAVAGCASTPAAVSSAAAPASAAVATSSAPAPVASQSSAVAAASGGNSKITNGTVSGTLQSMIDPNDEYDVVCCVDGIEYWNAHRFALEQAGRLYGVKTVWNGMTGQDVSQMSTLFDNVAAKKPAGIIVLGWDEGLAPSINKAEAAGIPVVTFSSDVTTSNRETWVGTDQHDLGFTGGKKFADFIGGNGKIAILSNPGHQLTDGREQGFRDAFKEYPGISVVALGNTQTDQTVAVQAAKDILSAHPDLTGFVCTEATGPMGAATAVQEAGLTGKVKILGLDRDTAMLQQIKAGTITGSVVQEDSTMMYWCLTVLITAKYYDPYAELTSDNKAASAKLTPNKIDTAINFISKDNVDLYMAANQVYLADTANAAAAAAASAASPAASPAAS
jgi:ribose transport system substrate-binding protein